MALLARWGLLDKVIASGTPATRRVRFDTGEVVLAGHFPTYDGIDALYSPRRTILDALLVDAARAAGAEVREGFRVEELLVTDGRAVGIRGKENGGRTVTESARLLVGADGKHSLVARTVGAHSHRTVPPLTLGSHTYWSGVPVSGGEVYIRHRRAVGGPPMTDCS